MYSDNMFNKDELKQRASAARTTLKDRSISYFISELKKHMLTTADNGKDSGTFFVNKTNYSELIDVLGPLADIIGWLIDHVKHRDEFEGITFKLRKLEGLIEYSWV